MMMMMIMMMMIIMFCFQQTKDQDMSYKTLWSIEYFLQYTWIFITHMLLMFKVHFISLCAKSSLP